uniref:Uncharacterized protein n=1 Tax=Alexandrium monilatum TaxID=311494 RepID=A0A7S4QCH9_9DINO
MARDPRASFVRAQVRHREAPRVLCADAQTAKALTSLMQPKVQVTRLAEDPVEMMGAQSDRESVVLGSPRSTLGNLAKQGKSFDAIFLPKDILADLPAEVRAVGCRAVAVESLPEAAK